MPATYERLSKLVRAVGAEKGSARALPLLSRAELIAALQVFQPKSFITIHQLHSLSIEELHHDSSLPLLSRAELIAALQAGTAVMNRAEALRLKGYAIDES